MPSSPLAAPVSRQPLRRLVGGLTAFCISIGVAIGSGIFRTPAEVARQLGSPSLIIAMWVFGGAFTLAAGLVSAELATRFPRAGGDYVFLREAYGEFAAFFFGWCYTIFIIGGGAATIAVAIGEFGCTLFNVPGSFGTPMALGSLVIIVALNAIGLRTGAGVQNLLSLLKLVALVGVAVAAIAADRPDAANVVAETGALQQAWTARSGWGVGAALMLALQNVLWPFDGVTDSVKMAEEVRDVRRTLPRAMTLASLLLTAVYVLVIIAYMAVLPPGVLASSKFVASEVARRVAGAAGDRLVAGLVVLLCLGSLASTTLATVRVTFALARDGLALRRFGRMSQSQSPVAALVFIGLIAAFFVLTRDFDRVLGIYTFAAAVLFSMVYGALIVVRRRAGVDGPEVYRCPAGPLLAWVLILLQAGLAIAAAVRAPGDIAASAGLAVVVAIFYFIRRRFGQDS